jgi:glucuronate isomerase
MSKPFIHDNFILDNNHAEKLYHEYAKDLPIIDYHCHLPPEEISGNKQWTDLSDIWLGGDHYKWRALRSNGVAEKYCTGDASPREKFDKWAETMPNLLKNPLYHWTQLELKRYFGIDELLSPKTADMIWGHCNAKLKEPGLSARGLMTQSKVKLVCTTDDPIDNLEHHIAVANDNNFNIKVLPTWRPDKAMAIENPEVYNEYVAKLEKVSDTNISSYGELKDALQKRHQYFIDNGCRLSDHGLETAHGEDYTEHEVCNIFEQIRSGNQVDALSVEKFKSAMMIFFAEMDHAAGWTQQIHIGAQRNNNTRLFNNIGPDTGFDSIGDMPVGKALSNFLDKLDTNNKLAKTILYNLNPRDNALYGTMIGNYQDGSSAGKIQWGSGWWFLDQKSGMEDQIDTLSNLGLLSRFVGMLTDSRSFLSYTRHEYFRRILCNILGHDIAKGIVPEDYDLVGELVKNVCYHNAENYFGIDL